MTFSSLTSTLIRFPESTSLPFLRKISVQNISNAPYEIEGWDPGLYYEKGECSLTLTEEMFKELNINLNKKPFYKSFRIRLEDKTPEHDIRVKRNIISGSINININLKVLNSEKIRDYLMRMNGNVRLIGILVLGMLVLVSQVVSATPDPQTWYFTGGDASAPTWSGADYNKIMTKGVEGGDVTITLARLSNNPKLEEKEGQIEL